MPAYRKSQLRSLGVGNVFMFPGGRATYIVTEKTTKRIRYQNLRGSGRHTKYQSSDEWNRDVEVNIGAKQLPLFQGECSPFCNTGVK